MWPYFVPRLRDYEGLAPYCCSRPAAAAPTRVRGKAAKDGKGDWLLEIGERIAHVPHSRPRRRSG